MVRRGVGGGQGRAYRNTPRCDIMVKGLGDGIMCADWFIACCADRIAAYGFCLETMYVVVRHPDYD